MASSSDQQTVLQTQILLKIIDTTPLISFDNHFIVQSFELINNHNNGLIGATNRFDLGGEDRTLIPESISKS